MNREQNKINCPKCGEEINVNDILYHQVDEQLKEKYDKDITKEKDKYNSLSLQLKKERNELEYAKNKQSEQIDKQVRDELKKQKIFLKKKYKTEAEEEQGDAINSLREDIKEKSGKIKELNKASAELEKLKREKDELEDSIKAKSEKELNEKLKIEKEKIQKEEANKNELKSKELNKAFAELEKLKREKNELEYAKNKQSEQIDKQVRDELKKQKIFLKKKYKTEAEEEQGDAINSLREDIKEKSGKIKELNKASAELEKLKREKDELEDSIKAKSEKELNEKLKIEKEKIQKEEENKNELKNKELEQQLAAQKKLTDEMKRKQEQGSMQIQGEMQELGIEEWLSDKFPLDTIQEIKKGERGADCLQIVHTRTRQNCGSIYYESKRTKAFQQSWIEKFKVDIVEKKANIGVLVTEAMPTDMDRFGLKNGIWICSFDEFKGLCAVLRESIINISTAVTTHDNKGNKMGMLYDFLTSNEFALQIEAIVEGFSLMQIDLLSEKRAMNRIWSKREKQIEKVIANTSRMYGSIKGIAGNAIQTVQLLELPSNSEDDKNV